MDTDFTPSADSRIAAADVNEPQGPQETFDHPTAEPALGTPEPATAPAPAPAPPGPPADDRYAQIERRLNELSATVAPILTERHQTLQQQANRPPIDPEKIRTGEATAAEFAQYNEWLVDQRMAQVRQSIARESRLAMSEMRARGQYSAEVMGAGNDYDSLRAKYLEPAYRQNPALRQVGELTSPDDPALGEMAFALFLHMGQVHGGNYVNAFKAIVDAVGARAAGAEDVSRSIQQAAERGAQKIQRAAGPGATPKGEPTSDDIWNMTDKKFIEKYGPIN